MGEYFIIGDSHSHHKAIKALLKQEGLLKGGKRLRPDVTVIHLGDLLNSVISSRDDDLKSLELVENGTINFLVLGNHETPYFNLPAFAGFFNFPEIKERLDALYKLGVIKPAMAIEDEILLTHAGLGKTIGDGIASPQEAVQDVDGAFLYDKHDSIISAIPWARGGSVKHGGIFWADWSEAKSTKFTQIVGHTSKLRTIRTYSNRSPQGENRMSLSASDL